MGYTVPEWTKDNESVVNHFLELFDDYMETYEEDFSKDELGEK